MSKRKPCGFEKIVRILGRKWSLVIICQLMDSPKRFSELERVIEGISPKVLTETLDFLEREGLVERVVVGEKPVRVFYRLTKKGEALGNVIYAIVRWESEWDHV